MKLIITAKTVTEKSIVLSNPLSMRYSANSFIPCDSLELSLELQHFTEKFAEIKASLDGFIFFDGIVDTQQQAVSSSGKLLTLYCRSKTALLLDNEIKPYFYFQLTSAQLFERYARPFGVVSHEFPYEAKKNFIQVRKGMTYWHIIDEFCRLVYRKSAYMTQDKRLVLNPLNNTQHILSNTSTGAVNYSKIAVKRSPCKLVSRVHLKTATEAYGYAYGVVTDNKNALSQGVKRERFYHPISKISKDAQAEVAEIIKESNRASFSVEIAIPALSSIRIGDRVRLDDPLYSSSRLAVSELSYIINHTGICTKLILSDISYI